MNTTINQIIQLDTYLRGGKAQVPDDDGEIQFEASVDYRDGACLLLNPTTGKCRIQSWLESGHNGDAFDTRIDELNDAQTSAALSAAWSTLFMAAKRRVEEQHAVAATFARNKAIEDATKRAVGLPS